MIVDYRVGGGIEFGAKMAGNRPDSENLITLEEDIRLEARRVKVNENVEKAHKFWKTFLEKHSLVRFYSVTHRPSGAQMAELDEGNLAVLTHSGTVVLGVDSISTANNICREANICFGATQLAKGWPSDVARRISPENLKEESIEFTSKSGGTIVWNCVDYGTKYGVGVKDVQKLVETIKKLGLYSDKTPERSRLVVVMPEIVARKVARLMGGSCSALGLFNTTQDKFMRPIDAEHEQDLLIVYGVLDELRRSGLFAASEEDRIALLLEKSLRQREMMGKEGSTVVRELVTTQILRTLGNIGNLYRGVDRSEVVGLIAKLEGEMGKWKWSNKRYLLFVEFCRRLFVKGFFKRDFWAARSYDQFKEIILEITNEGIDVDVEAITGDGFGSDTVKAVVERSILEVAQFVSVPLEGAVRSDFDPRLLICGLDSDTPVLVPPMERNGSSTPSILGKVTRILSEGSFLFSRPDLGTEIQLYQQTSGGWVCITFEVDEAESYALKMKFFGARQIVVCHPAVAARMGDVARCHVVGDLSPESKFEEVIRFNGHPLLLTFEIEQLLRGGSINLDSRELDNLYRVIIAAEHRTDLVVRSFLLAHLREAIGNIFLKLPGAARGAIMVDGSLIYAKDPKVKELTDGIYETIEKLISSLGACDPDKFFRYLFEILGIKGRINNLTNVDLLEAGGVNKFMYAVRLINIYKSIDQPSPIASLPHDTTVSVVAEPGQ